MANLSRTPHTNLYQNRSTFAEVTDKSIFMCFYAPRCIVWLVYVLRSALSNAGLCLTTQCTTLLVLTTAHDITSYKPSFCFFPHSLQSLHSRIISLTLSNSNSAPGLLCFCLIKWSFSVIIIRHLPYSILVCPQHPDILKIISGILCMMFFILYNSTVKRLKTVGKETKGRFVARDIMGCC